MGHFQPQQGKPALWELDSDQHHNVRGHGPDLVDEGARYYIPHDCKYSPHENFVQQQTIR